MQKCMVFLIVILIACQVESAGPFPDGYDQHSDEELATKGSGDYPMFSAIVLSVIIYVGACFASSLILSVLKIALEKILVTAPILALSFEGLMLHKSKMEFTL